MVSFYGLPRILANIKIEKVIGSLLLLWLYLSLAQDRSERFSTAFKESNSKLCSLATLVFSSSHLPGLLWFTYFLFALRTFSHEITLETVCSHGNKRLTTWQTSRYALPNGLRDSLEV
jgi:hypothetical protein